MDRLVQDLRHALRSLWKRPGFTAVAVITLALAIGAITSIFTVVNGVLLRPLPYREPDRIITLWQRNDKTGALRDEVAPANFLDWKERNRVFEQLAAADPYSFDYDGPDGPENLVAWFVTDGFFDVLGVNALHGRTFVPEEFREGNDRAVVLSHGAWQRRFGSDPKAVGRTIQLDKQPFTIVGVLPPQVKFPADKEIWVPRTFTEEDRQDRFGTRFVVIGRLKTGATLAQAASELNSVSAQLARESPRTNADIGVTAIALPEQITGPVRPALLILLGAVTFVLLIACANIANLLLVRGAERGREFAIRAALGAGRARLIRQLITESVVLALVGGCCGILLAQWGVDLLLAFSPANLPRLDEVGLDARVLGFAACISVLTALAFGLAPAIRFSKPDLQESLKEGGRTATAGLFRQRFRNALVVTEIALALVLLIGAGLLIRSFVSLLNVNPGFTTDNILALQVFIWDEIPEPEKRLPFYDQAFAALSSLPGVESVGGVSSLPFFRFEMPTTFTVEGRPSPAPGQELSAYRGMATPDYFRTLGIPLGRGRFFTRFDDSRSAPVVLINESLARRYFPGEDPLDKKVLLRTRDGRPVPRTIVGVIGDMRPDGLDSDPRPEIYLPYHQTTFGEMTFVIRTTGDPQQVLPAVRQQLWSLHKDITFYRVATMEQLVSESLAARRFNLFLLSAFAAIALALAGVGIYGLISFATSQRTHEIGVRMALGAQAGDVLKMVVRQGMILALAGVGLGLIAALALTRLMSSLLFGVTPTDPLTYTGVSVLLTTVALLACYIPARRATKVDPMVALRYE
ncbi:MAG TPA: ABC transporter permease [Pyrinomonadaceae bacterium]|nr:ABC transporter permease [Pyrinomonadaceae bacterium]